MKAFFSRILSYFVQGVILSFPVAATFYVLYLLFMFIDGIIPVSIPGLGILILFVALTLFGFIGSSFIGRSILGLLRDAMLKWLDKAPLLKTIYTSAKDLISAFVGKDKSFDQPVLVKLSKESNIKKLGFITRKDLNFLGLSGMVAVYLPHSYNFSGNLFIVEAENVELIHAKPSDVMKFIVSGGITHIETRASSEIAEKDK